MRVSKGIIRAYDATNHKADVLLVGSLSRVALGVPVSYQVAPEEVAKDTACGLLFFGEGDAGLVICTFDEVPIPPLDLDAVGPKLDIYDLMRGWRDDFLGRALHDQYETEILDGSVTLVDGRHGGAVRVRANAGGGNWARLWLGTAAGNHDTLDADYGWVQIAIVNTMYQNDAGIFVFGASDSTSNEYITVGARSGNWTIRCRAGGVYSSTVGGAVDTSYHVHAAEVYPTGGGHQVDYWLDGVLVASHTTDIPTAVITPFLYVYTPDAEIRYMECDSWAVIPR